MRLLKVVKYSLLFYLLLLPILSNAAPESTCYGTTSKGRLENGVMLPGSGENFVSHGLLPELAGRTYVHSKVRDIILDSYRMLAHSHPDKVFKYGDTGFAEGGQFRPHRTHENGLSVDFMVPVIDEEGDSVALPSNLFNHYGYGIEFNQDGIAGDLKIDFEALGAHIVALHKAARQHGVDLWRVIFAPDLQPHLYATRHGDYIRQHIKIPNKRSWVRHDEHIHVDFAIPCRRR